MDARAAQKLLRRRIAERVEELDLAGTIAEKQAAHEFARSYLAGVVGTLHDLGVVPLRLGAAAVDEALAPFEAELVAAGVIRLVHATTQVGGTIDGAELDVIEPGG